MTAKEVLSSLMIIEVLLATVCDVLNAFREDLGKWLTLLLREVFLFYV